MRQRNERKAKWKCQKLSMVGDLKNSCDVIINRKDATDKRINKFEYTSTEIIHTISQREKERKKQRIQDLRDNIKWPNIHVIGITVEGETGNSVEETLKETMHKTFPRLMKDIHPQI